MCLRPLPVPPIPEETARVAQTAFPHGNPYLRLRDEFGTLFEDADFAALFPTRGQPAEAPWRLALVTVLQFAEGLSDRRAADAVRGRIDWKYLLGLELTDPGFDASVLCEFRSRLVAGGQEALLFEKGSPADLVIWESFADRTRRHRCHARPSITSGPAARAAGAPRPR